MSDLNLKVLAFLSVRGTKLAKSSAGPASHKLCFEGHLTLVPSLRGHLLSCMGISFEPQTCKETKDLNDDPIPPDTSSI